MICGYGKELEALQNKIQCDLVSTCDLSQFFFLYETYVVIVAVKIFLLENRFSRQ